MPAQGAAERRLSRLFLLPGAAATISGPVRTLYVRDITMIGTTAWVEPVFPDLIGYIERGEITPLVAKSFPLCQIAAVARTASGRAGFLDDA